MSLPPSMTDDELRAEHARRTRTPDTRIDTVGPSYKDEAPAQPKKKKAPRRSKQMNQTETRFQRDYLKGVGHFEQITLRLADDVRYTPDFHTMSDDGVLFFWEVKGPKVWDDARVKVRVAAQLYPYFRFIVAQWKDKRWTLTGIEPTPA